MSSLPRHPVQGLAVTPHHADSQRHDHPDRGLVHAVPVLAFGIGGLVYPLYVLVDVFRVANADIETVPGAPFAAAAAAFLAFLAGVLIASFVTMLAYTVARFGRTHSTRVLQLLGLGGTLVCAVAGIALVFVVASMY